jgi:hypothetical protein
MKFNIKKEYPMLSNEELKTAITWSLDYIAEVLNTTSTYDEIVHGLVDLKTSQYTSRNINHHFWMNSVVKDLFVRKMLYLNVYDEITDIAKENNII